MSPGDKIVLGHQIKQNGEKEGMEVLRMLARASRRRLNLSAPNWRRVSFPMIRRSPGRSNGADISKKDGDIREVLKTMFQSPEFWSADTYRAKVKTPLEFVVSAVRAPERSVTDALPLAAQLNNAGDAAVRHAAADRLLDESGGVGEFVSAAGPHEFRDCADAGKVKGVQIDLERLLNGTSPAIRGQPWPHWRVPC